MIHQVIELLEIKGDARLDPHNNLKIVHASGKPRNECLDMYKR